MTDQNTFESALWGTLAFCPTSSDKWKDNCRHCLLWVRKDCQQPDDECCHAPCTPDTRRDHQSGYYSIHQMPKHKGF